VERELFTTLALALLGLVAGVLFAAIGAGIVADDPAEEDQEVRSELVEVPTDGPVVLQQCADGGICGPPVVVDGGTGRIDVVRHLHDLDCRYRDCRIVVTGVGSTAPILVVPVPFGRTEPVPAMTRPTDVPGPELPTGRVATGVAVAVVLTAAATWLLRRRPGEEVEDPFWGVSLEVPEWDGVRVELDDEEWLSPVGGPPARRGR
jgi:hypothetical protein